MPYLWVNGRYIAHWAHDNLIASNSKQCPSTRGNMRNECDYFVKCGAQYFRYFVCGIHLTAKTINQKVCFLYLMGTSKNAQMSPNRGSGRHPASGFWRSVAPERLI